MQIKQIGGAEAAHNPSTDAMFRRRSIPSQVWSEGARLVEAFLNRPSPRTSLAFQEAMAVDDFRAVAFDILDREVMARYQDITPVWSQYVSSTMVRDFKPKRLVDLMGGRAGLDLVPELTEYPERTVNKALYYLSVEKFGGLFAVSFEAQVNDDLGEIAQMPNDLAIGARDTESREAASLLTDGNGANSACFNATAWGRTYNQKTDTWSGGQSNLIAGNPELTVDSLATAIQDIKQRRDPEGRPIQVPKFKLVVPQAGEVNARRVLAMLQIRTETTVGEVTTVTLENNWAAGLVELVVDPWLDVLDQGANTGTEWWIVPDPASQRKALYLGFMNGRQVPELRVKADTGNTLSGGSIAPSEGSFDTDDIRYRVRHILGTTSTDMIATAYSDGTGS